MVNHEGTDKFGAYILTECCKCKLLFKKYKKDSITEYSFWCDRCFVNSTPAQRYPKPTAEEMAEDKARQERTRLSLKQRKAEKKQQQKGGTGKGKGKGKGESEERRIAPAPDNDTDFLIFNQSDED